MEKQISSVKVDTFGKHLKKDFNAKQIAKIYKTIEQFEQAEKDFMHSGDRTHLNQFGKTLSKIGHKDIYCLEVGNDRFLAKVIEDEHRKLYAWYWAGSHEKYNNVLAQLSSGTKHIAEEKIQSALQEQQTPMRLSEKNHPNIAQNLLERRAHSAAHTSNTPSFSKAHPKS